MEKDSPKEKLRKVISFRITNTDYTVLQIVSKDSKNISIFLRENLIKTIKH
jgi:hypothetical protein